MLVELIQNPDLLLTRAFCVDCRTTFALSVSVGLLRFANANRSRDRENWATRTSESSEARQNRSSRENETDRIGKTRGIFFCNFSCFQISLKRSVVNRACSSFAMHTFGS